MVHYQCHCTVGGHTCLNNTCTIEHDGFCYSYVREIYNEELQQYEDEREWGCLGGAEGALMQCHGHFSRHGDPKAIFCCRPNVTRDFDFKCNEDILPDYTRRPDQEHFITWSQWLTTAVTSPTFMWISGFLTLFMLFTCCLVATYYTCRLFWRYRRLLCCCFFDDSPCCDSMSSRSSNDSVLKEKSPDYAGASGKSTSISDDIDHLKLDIANSSMCDMTSGRGGPLLIKRTIALDITLHEPIGKGRFGEVRRASFNFDEVAVKIFKSWDEASFRREDYIYTHCLKPHDNILGFVCSDLMSRDGNLELWLVTHFCAKRSMHEYLTVNILSPEQALDLIYSVISGLHYLHTEFECQTKKPAIAHRDLKTKNILMKCDNVACIADFGHAAISLPYDRVDKGPSEELRVGTKRYMAPEVLDQTMANPQAFSSYVLADIYQFALVVWEICRRTQFSDTEVPPYMLPYGDKVPDDPSIEDMLEVVCAKQLRPRILDVWLQDRSFSELASLLDECWRPMPTARLSALNIKKKIYSLRDNRQSLFESSCGSSNTGTTNTMRSYVISMSDKGQEL